jgi:hypothetical protein
MAITERGGVALVIILIFTITSSFFLVMRIVARAWVIRSFGWDDIIMVAAMVRIPDYLCHDLSWQKHGALTQE